MMMEENQSLNAASNAFQAKPEEPQIELNSQGLRVEKQSAPQQQERAELSLTDDVIPLWDTPLSEGIDDLMPPTDDTGMEHKIISCGHVLKSTHDLARWSEKTGALRVNTQEAFDSVSDITISLEGTSRRNNNNNGNSNNNNNNGNRRRTRRSGNNGQQWQQKSEIISAGPVLKSTHDLASWSEKRGANAVNGPESFRALDDAVSGQQSRQQGQRGGRQQRQQGWQQGQKSEIISCGPVLKSTHDLATRAEKTGPNAVNGPESIKALDDAANSQGSLLQGGGLKGMQAGGSGLQSGLDTQAGSHMQQNSEKVKETPEQVMQSLNVHV